MKKGLKLLLIYFVFLIFSLILGTFVYALYLNLLDFVAESQSSFSFLEYCKESFFFMMSFVLIFICPLICYYRIRHSHGFIQTIFYVFICIFTWCILFPCTSYIKDKFYDEKNIKIEKKDLTKEVFRETNNHVYYFLRDFYTDSTNLEETPAIIIDKNDGDMNFAVVADSSDFELYENAKPYREILIKKSFLENIPSFMDFNLIIRRADLAIQKGLSFYLGFLTFAFAICAVFAMTNFFKWKLISVTTMIFNVAGICIINSIYYYQGFSSIIFKLTNNNFFDFLNNYFDEPLLCLINFFIGLIFTTIGIVHYFICTKNKNRI